MSTTASPRYGKAHRRLRKWWASKIAAGGVLCARCHRPILPGQIWELGHDDIDPSLYNGPEHRKCNRATSRHRYLRKLRRSRDW